MNTDEYSPRLHTVTTLHTDLTTAQWQRVHVTEEKEVQAKELSKTGNQHGKYTASVWQNGLTSNSWWTWRISTWKFSYSNTFQCPIVWGRKAVFPHTDSRQPPFYILLLPSSSHRNFAACLCLSSHQALASAPSPCQIPLVIERAPTGSAMQKTSLQWAHSPCLVSWRRHRRHSWVLSGLLTRAKLTRTSYWETASRGCRVNFGTKNLDFIVANLHRTPELH